MVNGLEIPAKFSGGGIKGDDAVGVEVRSFAIGAIKAVGGIAEWDEDEAALVVNGHGAPGAGAGAIFPAIGSPSLVAGLTEARHGMEAPDEFAGAGVEGARIAAGAFAGTFLRGGTEDDQTLIDGGWRSDGVVRVGIVIGDSGAEVDFAVVAEIEGGPAGFGVERDEAGLGGKDNARLGFGIAGPIGDASVLGDAGAFRIIGPELLAGFGLEGDDAVLLRGEVHDAANDDGRVLPGSAGVTGVIAPGTDQGGDVLGVDLIKRGIFHAARITAVGRPVGRVLGKESGGTQKAEGECAMHGIC